MQQQFLPKVGRYDFRAEPFHCDFRNQLFLGHLGNELLNAADYHSSDRGYGMTYLMGIHRAWVLSRLAIELKDIPHINEHFQVATWVENALRYFTSRNFAITDGGDKVFGYGRSIWAMINTTTRQPSDIFEIQNGIIQQYIETDEPCPIAKPSRVKMDDAEWVRTINTNYCDVDINGHINSVKYIEHVLDLWDMAWYSHHHVKRLDVAYIAESHQGDFLNFYMKEEAPLSFAVRIMKSASPEGEKTETCRILLQFEKD
ncbi:MAG: acyl-[acyl-carrier-protein] thioesterase [Prevotella sp.]|jgi:medium-chain acyl-[acyl-carrier-protein] hydrolase